MNLKKLLLGKNKPTHDDFLQTTLTKKEAELADFKKRLKKETAAKRKAELVNSKKQLEKEIAAKIVPISVSQLDHDFTETLRRFREQITQAFAIPPETLGVSAQAHLNGITALGLLQLYEHVNALPEPWPSQLPLFKVLSATHFEGAPQNGWDPYDSFNHHCMRLAIFPLEEVAVAEIRLGAEAMKTLLQNRDMSTLVDSYLLLEPIGTLKSVRSSRVRARIASFTEVAIAVSERDLS